MTVADRIKMRREALGMTQEELAAKMGYDGKSSVSKMENSGDNVTLKKIARVAPCLQTSTAYLMGWVEDPNPRYNPRELDNFIYEDDTTTQLPDEDVLKAIDLYHQFQSVSPEVQTAIQLLLKSQQRDS